MSADTMALSGHGRGVVAPDPEEAPSRPEGSGTFALASWNIRNGRNGGLESAARALDSLGADIAFLQETKVTGGIYTRHSSGYKIVASDAPSKQKGRIALAWREDHEAFEVEATAVRAPGVMTFQLRTGNARYYVIGCYIAPSDTSTVADVRAAWGRCPKGCIPLLLGDLNADLSCPRDGREEDIAELVDEIDLVDASSQFRQRCRGRYSGRWTWSQRRLGRRIESQPDYLLTRERCRRRFRRVGLRKPRHHDSDHRAVIAIVRGGKTKRLGAYRRRRRRIPLRLARPLGRLETAFEEAKEACKAVPPRKREANSWISEATWALVDHRAMLRYRGDLSQRVQRMLGRRIRASLQDDRKARTARVGTAIQGHLAGGDLKEAWRCVKGWYRTASEVPPRPCFQTMERQTQERVELYGKVNPPGAPIPINVDAFDVADDAPSDGELRVAVATGLRNGRAGGASRVRAEDMKEWLRGARAEEKAQEEGLQGHEGAGDRWRALVELIQAIWEMGYIPQQMLWVIVVLIPKGGGDYRGIGLLEPFWKLIEVVMDRRLNIVELHDSLHGFRAGRGCGTATIEAKLAQQLAFLEQEPFYGVFIDLRKAYDAMDRERCLAILEGYGVGQNMLRLLRYFWDEAVLVCRAAGNYGKPFKAGRGVTQGGPLSPKIFNIMVDAIVREWFRLMMGDEAAMEGYGEEFRRMLAIFYADDAFVASRLAPFLQEALDTLVDLFERVGLRTNVRKTKTMVCVPGKVRTRWRDSSYRRRYKGLNSRQEWESRRVECDQCGRQMSAASLRRHLETQHAVYQASVVSEEALEQRAPRTYRVYQSADGVFRCPVPGCPGSAPRKWNVRRHFRDRHPHDLADLPGEGVYPRCPNCGMQTNPTGMGRHRGTALCREGGERLRQHEAAVNSALALRQEFTAYGDVLERVEVFRYLGRLLAMDDVDRQAVDANLRKARRAWARLERLLRAENAPPRVCGMFYKATVQAVLLFGSETWALTPTVLRRLEGFHVRAAYRMAAEHRPQRRADGTWTYPATADVLEEVGMHTVEEYIRVRRDTIAAYVVDRAVYTACEEGERRRGSAPHQYWWEQPMSLDAAEPLEGDAADEDEMA